MSNIVLKVENLYKRYRLGNVDRTAFKEDIISFMAKLQGKPDPYESYITSNELAAAKDANEIKSRYVWSLQDINFEVQKGEILGIIGKNGAGKSTLLKILSKTTAPTKGNVKVKGRIASLLEVGTGFHPELTGRENIYMNGAIMGMMRHEITRKLDEIIAFAGVEAFIDTPVKRYSSGMYVRLAFAVAAHLEPDILIIDEVLAVGDAEFQKKCIGKMQDVSRGEGRTVLFVSHNMTAVKQLCTKAIYLKNGNLFLDGNIQEIVSAYFQQGVQNLTEQVWTDKEFDTEYVELLRVAVYAKGKTTDDYITTVDDVVLEVDFCNKKDKANIDVTFDIFDANGIHLCHFGMICNAKDYLQQEKYRTFGIIPKNLLNTNRYIINITFGLNQQTVLLRVDSILVFDVEDAIRTRGANFGKFPGIIHPICHWETIQL